MVESLLLVGATQGEPRCAARFFHHVPGRQHYPKSSAGSADADRNAQPHQPPNRRRAPSTSSCVAMLNTSSVKVTVRVAWKNTISFRNGPYPKFRYSDSVPLRSKLAV